ncbi:MAG TPA: hypothetical protein VF351_04950 [Actinomycetota bacterium]
MKKVLVIGMLGLAGLVAATSLTLGALAVAGDEVGSVLRPRLSDDRGGPSLAPSASDTKSPDPDRRGDDGSTRSWSPSSAPSGGGASSEPSSDDSGSSASGSDDSGSGSSGSGSDDSGSDDSEPDDD